MGTGKHVAILMGGWSAEREVSLRSGKACAAALDRLGYRVSPIDVGRDVAAVLAAIGPDVALNVLHGRPGEDGTIQGLLEVMAIPYSHSGVLASALAMQKDRAKVVMRDAGVPVPRRSRGFAARSRQGARAAAPLRDQADRRGIERRRVHRHRSPRASAAGAHPRQIGPSGRICCASNTFPARSSPAR